MNITSHSGSDSSAHDVASTYPIKSKTIRFAIATGAFFALARVGVNKLKNVDNSDVLQSIRRRVLVQDEETVVDISLIGERHSGTNWISDHLEKCFGDELQVKVSYSRFKHWFQFDYDNVKPKSTVVVAMFRDPYDWVQAMHERPRHAHEHINLRWREFVTKPWRGPRRINDNFLLKKAGGLESVITEVGSTCLSNFTWNEVIPCSVGDTTEIDGVARYMYELDHDGSGRAYPSIIDLRRDKILNFMTVKAMKGVKSFHPYRYEQLNREGTSSLIKTLEDATGKTAKCTPYPATGVIKHKKVPAPFIEWMNNNADWKVEAMVGYVKRQPQESRNVL